MRRSTDRILTTHVGSLPRPEGLIELMFARAEGEAVDPELLERKTRDAVVEVVAHQKEAGIDIVSDGEMSKPSYATYVTERLTGFGGTSIPPKLSDILEYPNVSSQYFNDPGVKSLNKNRPACNGPVASRGTADADKDIAHFRHALAQYPSAEAFMNAASPGVVSMFLGNTHYDSEREFLWAVADAMKPEYRAIIDAGLLLQLDCPDLAMTRHREFADAPLGKFREYAKLHIEVLNYVLQDFPRDRIRVHICWGNYPGPHHHDVPIEEIVDLLLTIHAGALLEGMEGRETPGRHGDHSRRDRIDEQPHRAPGTGGRAYSPLRGTGRTRERHRRQRLRLRDLRRPRPGGPWHRLGQAGLAGGGRPAGPPGVVVVPAPFGQSVPGDVS
jgi:5-methyltetrahydropteroyltriglutamate--homocysteine methyltransferase